MPSFRLGRIELRLRLWATLAAAVGIALTLALGNWQLGRASEKQALAERYEERARGPAVQIGPQELNASDLELRRVEASGQFEPRHTIYLDNRVHNKVPGYEVITPLRIGGSQRYVLVNRGWIAAERDRRTLPSVHTPDGAVTVSGVAIVPTERYLELSSEVVEGRVWQNLDLDRYRKKTGLDVHPVLIRQDGGAHDGLVREWSPPDYGRDTHLAYAVQWYALAIAILVYYLVTNVRRKPSP